MKSSRGAVTLEILCDRYSSGWLVLLLLGILWLGLDDSRAFNGRDNTPILIADCMS